MSDSHSIDEDQLRQALAEKPAETLSQQFAAHQQRLWRMVHFRMDPVLAARLDPDDILQEAWLAAAQRIDHFLNQESLSFFIWLRLVVGQTLIDVQRRHLGAKMRDAYREQSQLSSNFASRSDFSQNTSISLARRLIGNYTSPSGVAMKHEQAEKLRQAINEMDPIDREVLALRHFEELSNSETAQALQIQPKAASIRYVRAMRRLKSILESVPGFQEES